jgi:hypothetical protein
MKRLLLVAAGAALLCGASPSNAVPLARLSLQERLRTAPASTVVRLGTRTVTLGQMRAAHTAREANLEKAGVLGVNAAGALKAQKPVVLRAPVRGNISRNLGAVLSSNAVVEPPSQYSSTPADMKAFCSNANASACLYLPPQQQLTPWNGAILDQDGLIDQSTCQKEGGSWGLWFSWNGDVCGFNYPTSVVVHFTPSSSYKLTQTASCDKSMWSYQVDVHGAISIQAVPQYYANITTGTNPTCVVRVTLGG